MAAFLLIRTCADPVAAGPSSGPAQEAQTAVPAEYRLKAAFVDKFPQFVEWPPRAFDKRSDLHICVLSPNPFGRVLSDLAGDQIVEGRKVVVRTIDAGASLETCHVLFASSHANGRDDALRRAAALPILTIGDGRTTTDAEAVIQLRLIASKVRFEVNLTAARASGLRVSSQLLRLATRVHGGRS